MNSNSIGIIGGADGPTSILVSGHPAVYIIGAVCAVVVIAVVAAVLKKRNR